MKRSLLALAVLGAFAGGAAAQSSVTIFGVVDLSINHQSGNGTSVWTQDSNQLNSNRLGFRGVEDLGGGMKAGFWLEAGMSNDTGAGATGGALAFNRRSTVSLISDNWGEIRLGRDYTPSFWMTAVNDVFGANGIAQFDNLTTFAIGPLGTNATATVRANNSVAYFTPGNLGGFYARAQLALNESSVTPSGNKYAGFLAGWAAGPIDVAFGYGDTKVVGGDFKVKNVGGSYDFGVAKLIGLWNVSSADLATTTKLTTWGLSVAVPAGPGSFNASYVRAKADLPGGGAAPSANQIGAQYVYNLSKRTALYGGLARISNSDGAAFQFGDLPSSVNLTNQNVSAYNFGVRHSF